VSRPLIRFNVCRPAISEPLALAVTSRDSDPCLYGVEASLHGIDALADTLLKRPDRGQGAVGLRSVMARRPSSGGRAGSSPSRDGAELPSGTDRWLGSDPWRARGRV